MGTVFLILKCLPFFPFLPIVMGSLLFFGYIRYITYICIASGGNNGRGIIIRTIAKAKQKKNTEKFSVFFFCL